jgi:hypothetical protein
MPQRKIAMIGGTSTKAFTLTDLDEAMDAALETRTINDSGYSAVSWLYRCVTLRANAVATMPYALMQGDEELEDDPLLDILHNVLWLSEAAQCLYGASYWRKVANRAGTLFPQYLAASTMALDTMQAQKGNIQWQRSAGGVTETLTPKEVLYIWQPAPNIEIGPGVAPARVALAATNAAYNISEYTAAFFKRGAIPAVLLTVEGNPPDAELRRLEAWWKKLLQGVKRAWETVAVRASLKPVVVREMDSRYKLFETEAARNLDTYNAKMAKKKDGERLPRIVLMIDELADLMMQAPDETERTVVRLAQMARATGIHLVVATQRPSTDIVTGLIKANFPARISFAVASSIDSRVILDTQGAETLLGKGDMLFLSPEVGAPARLQGCFVTDKEVDRLVNYWREQMEDDEPEPDVVDQEIDQEADEAADQEEAKTGRSGERLPASSASSRAPWDEMLAREAVVEDKDRQIEQAIEIVKKFGTASASLLQRKMRIGYPRAARLMDELKTMGIVGRERTGGKTREVFIEEDDDPIGDRAARIIGGDEENDD